MSEIKLPSVFRVDIWEHERGWGSKIEETKYFDSEDEARKFCANFNAKNTAPVVPDWYMRADYVGVVK